MGPHDTRLSSPAERERSAAKDKGTGGQYVAVCSVSNSPLTHNPFATLSQPFRIKCERYIFLKKCVRSSLLLIMFPHVYVYSCICITAMQQSDFGWHKAFFRQPRDCRRFTLFWSAGSTEEKCEFSVKVTNLKNKNQFHLFLDWPHHFLMFMILLKTIDNVLNVLWPYWHHFPKDAQNFACHEEKTGTNRKIFILISKNIVKIEPKQQTSIFK